MSKQWKNALLSLYQQTRQELPPPPLEQKIRLAAQQALQRKSPNLKWYLSSAAVVLLAVNVVLFTYVPESEVIEIPMKSSSSPLTKAQPYAAIPQINPAPMMEPMPDSIETQMLEESTDRLHKEVTRSASEAKKYSPESPASNDYLSNSLQADAEQATQAAESNRVSGSIIQGEQIRHPQYLPFDVKRLIAGNSTLTGHQSTQSLEIKQNNKLILKMTRKPQGILIEAYAEAKLWGVYAKWGQSNEGLKSCTEEDLIICDLDNEVQGGFVKNRLMFIRWMQKSEP